MQSNEYELSNNAFALVSPEVSADEPQTPQEQQHAQVEGNSPTDYSDGTQQQAASEAEGEASAGVDEEAREANISMCMVTPYELDDDLDDFLSTDEFYSADEGDFDDDDEE